MEEWKHERRPKIRGAVMGYLYKLDNGGLMGVAIFNSREEYRDNAGYRAGRLVSPPSRGAGVGTLMGRGRACGSKHSGDPGAHLSMANTQPDRHLFSPTRRAVTIILEADCEDSFFEALHATWIATKSYPEVWPVADVQAFPQILQRVGLAG